MVAGSLDLYDEVVSGYVSQTGVPFLSVQYRLAPKVGGTKLAEDVYAGLVWLVCRYQLANTRCTNRWTRAPSSTIPARRRSRSPFRLCR